MSSLSAILSINKLVNVKEVTCKMCVRTLSKLQQCGGFVQGSCIWVHIHMIEHLCYRISVAAT